MMETEKESAGKSPLAKALATPTQKKDSYVNTDYGSYAEEFGVGGASFYPLEEEGEHVQA